MVVGQRWMAEVERSICQRQPVCGVNRVPTSFWFMSQKSPISSHLLVRDHRKKLNADRPPLPGPQSFHAQKSILIREKGESTSQGIVHMRKDELTAKQASRHACRCEGGTQKVSM